MTERLETLPAMKVARVQIPGPDRPTFSSTGIEIIKWVKKFAVAKVSVH
jgi:hypothetical protein